MLPSIDIHIIPEPQRTSLPHLHPAKRLQRRGYALRPAWITLHVSATMAHGVSIPHRPSPTFPGPHFSTMPCRRCSLGDAQRSEAHFVGPVGVLLLLKGSTLAGGGAVTLSQGARRDACQISIPPTVGKELQAGAAAASLCARSLWVAPGNKTPSPQPTPQAAHLRLLLKVNMRSDSIRDSLSWSTRECARTSALDCDRG